jgi:hypothetical protein
VVPLGTVAVLMNAGLLCDKAAMQRDRRKWTLCAFFLVLSGLLLIDYPTIQRYVVMSASFNKQHIHCPPTISVHHVVTKRIIGRHLFKTNGI